MRNMMVTTLAEDYVTGRPGQGPVRAAGQLSYAARNAICRACPASRWRWASSSSGALLTEIVFSYPGIGYVLYQAVLQQDYPLIQGIFLIITFAVLAANLLADVVYVFLDPRTRQEA